MKMIYTSTPEPTNVGKLLSEPSDGDASSFVRENVNFEDHSERFKLKERHFQRQYAHLYAERLQTFRPKLTKAAENKWGKDVPIRKLFELKVDEKCIVVGTLFKQMDLKPNILKEISEEHNLMPQPARTKFTDDSDKLILEDELQRIVLVGDIDTHAFVTGINVAVYGREPDEDRGKFHVEGLCFVELPPQVAPSTMTSDKYVAIVSGLNIGSNMENLIGQQLMIDLLTGQLGDEGQQEDTAKVVRLIVAGNSLSQSTQDRENHSKAKYLSKNTAAGTVSAIRSLDDSLVQVASCMEVDIMPGEFDPANHILPQQPLHRCMFPQTSTYPTLHCVTNPFEFSLDGVRFLGCSGQTVNDIYKFSMLEDRLDILERTITWGHLAPTAPDTLGCYPFYEKDPFILEQCPHIYFVGNQERFQQKLFEGPSGQRIRLITVPRFSETAMCIMVNLRTLECQPVTFGASFLSTSKQEVSPDVDK